MVAALKGYKWFKSWLINRARKSAMRYEPRAEVVICPTNVAPEDPRSYYEVAKRLRRKRPTRFTLTSITTRLTRSPLPHAGPEGQSNAAKTLTLWF